MTDLVASARPPAVMTPSEVERFLSTHPLFATLPPAVRQEIAEQAEPIAVEPGQVILDAFTHPSTQVYVVVDGQVHLWNSADQLAAPPDETISRGEIFGFSAMLTERSLGPRAVAASPVIALRITGPAVMPAFASREGAAFLAQRLFLVGRQATAPAYANVAELLYTTPLVVTPETPIAQVAAGMSAGRLGYAVVQWPDHPKRLALVTDATLRERVIVDGLGVDAPIAQAATLQRHVAHIDDATTTALVTLLDSESEFLIVTDDADAVRGVVCPRDFAISPATGGVSLHEQLRRVDTDDELVALGKRVPSVVGGLLGGGLATGRVIAIHSSLLDTLVRQAIRLTFERHTELTEDAFTWYAVGSNGRREAVLSSDLDAAVVFSDALSPAEQDRYRAAFAEVTALLDRAGLHSDRHGTTPPRPEFSPTASQLRQWAEAWRDAPEKDNGAVRSAMLLDARPIVGQLGRPAALDVFRDMRAHLGTQRMLLQASLNVKVHKRSLKEVLLPKSGTFDIKKHALFPIVQLAQWAALVRGSDALSTPERLLAAKGSMILPDDEATRLAEVFEVLQRIRLRYQLMQVRAGMNPSDLLALRHLSAIDRSVIHEAVHEVAAIQRRAANVAAYVDIVQWADDAT